MPHTSKIVSSDDIYVSKLGLISHVISGVGCMIAWSAYLA